MFFSCLGETSVAGCTCLSLFFSYCGRFLTVLLSGACRVKFRLKGDTNLFEIVKCKTSVSTI
jgi:hypothetical protein